MSTKKEPPTSRVRLQLNEPPKPPRPTLRVPPDTASAFRSSPPSSVPAAPAHGNQAQQAAAPNDVVAALEVGGEEIKRVAAGLNERIQRFETWVANLPGRVTTYVHIPDPLDGPEWEFHLRLAGSGKKWRLHYMYQNARHGHDEDADWEVLMDATIEAKMAGLQAVPLLFEQLHKAQTAFIQRMRDAQSKFDAFANSKGISTVEGA